MSAEVARTAAAWPRLSIYQDLQAENAALRAENESLRALLRPAPLSCPARWRLSWQQREFLSLLYHQPGCVSHERLAAALGTPEQPVCRQHLQVIACHLRRKLSTDGVEIEAHYGLGYSLTVEGRDALTRALDVLQSLRVSRAREGL